ncbi:unnamed protein product [Brassica oleracea]
MIDSGSDHGGSSRSVVTGSLGGTARFVEVRLVAESDFKVFVGFAHKVCIGFEELGGVRFYSPGGALVALVFGGGGNIFWFAEEALPWGDGAYEARGEHTQGPMERLSWD